jgi:cell division protein ZapB
MDEKLSALEERVHQLVQLCGQLRKVNSELRQQLASSQSDTGKLQDKIVQARARLETLLEQIPESSE